MMSDSNDLPESLQTISAYVEALSRGNGREMEKWRAPDFVLDFVHGDAFEDGPLTASETQAFWPAWFAAFPEMDYEVNRTIAAESVVVTQWVFTGHHARPLGPPIFEESLSPSGRTIRFRGVTVYDLAPDGRIRRETTYMDLATLMVELGVTP